MSPFKAKKLGLLFVGAAVCALFAAQGCGDSTDDQAAPKAGSSAGGKSGAGTGGKGSAGNAGKTAGGGKGGEETGEGGSGNTGNEPGMGGDTGMGGDMGEGGAMNCDGPDGCYNCTPTNDNQLQNHCIPGGCPASFDNSTLTKLNLVGTL